MDKDSAIKSLLEEAAETRWEIGQEFHDKLSESIYQNAAHIADRTVIKEGQKENFNIDRTIDSIVTSPIWGFPIMFCVLAVVLWLTIIGSNYPSQFLAFLLLDNAYEWLRAFAIDLGTPWWLNGFLIDGVFLSLAWVISVMLPPMAIFFPLFTILEDLGYLPRIAFNLDALFRKSGAHGKQALTMSMGFGCNAAGVIATRIIDSPRERLIAIITNNFSLCNGRWPTQILLGTIFIGQMVPDSYQSLVSTASVIGVALLGIGLTFASSWALSKTFLKGEVSSFTLELPPYRKPRILQTIYTSLIDRTLIVLWRACVFAAPAGAVIWLVCNITIGDTSIANHLIYLMDNFGLLIGLNGVILLAYVLAIPANEIVIPTILMLTVMTAPITGYGSGDGVMFELDSLGNTHEVLVAGGWTLLTAINVMLFSLIHNPCSTTIYTIYKETNSVRWTTLASIGPVILGFIVCFVVAQVYYML
ncbi:nucleoside recognition domain-containing protein [Flammeovirga sp. OC4]|uniref:nucleoside recognition domain-containing protein n=1 Tax=Flammeovirga sp. OC4 TaxID=1382345 RepID=UPI0005C6CAE1|nr:nucleoside recognition domain-containing protein [Flammeovirga sp. OC4]